MRKLGGRTEPQHGPCGEVHTREQEPQRAFYVESCHFGLLLRKDWEPITLAEQHEKDVAFSSTRVPETK